MRRQRALALAGVLCIVAHPAAAQLARDSSTDWLSGANSESERYLRTITTVSGGAAEQWSIRPFSSGALRRMATANASGPWAGRLTVRPHRQIWASLVQPEMGGVFNSRFPYGFNDGPLWAGRGLTVVAAAGVHGGVGPLEFSIAPTLFRAQNASFPTVPNRLGEPNPFADVQSPTTIDLPQRFGNGAYQRLDPGQSWVQLGALGLVAGVSTANEAWGPAEENPFLLGTNAPGFAHLYAGTNGPLALGPVTLSVRLVAGRLDQSAYSPVITNPRRYLSGLIAVLGIRQLPGLELGAGRMFENVWPDSGVNVRDILDPFLHNPFKQRREAVVGGKGEEPDNQLGSVFARWAFPASGMEVYGELGRDDNSYDLRDLLLEPDHSFAFLAGFRRTWVRPRGELLVLRGELLNSAVSHLTQVRNEGPLYIHTPVRQGHTQLGQLLGAPTGYAGGGTTVALDWFTADGRRTVTYRRMLREPGELTTTPRDVVHAMTVDWLLFRPRVDLAPELTLAYNLNRDQGGDVMNLRGAVTGRVHW